MKDEANAQTNRAIHCTIMENESVWARAYSTQKGISKVCLWLGIANIYIKDGRSGYRPSFECINFASHMKTLCVCTV